MKRIFLNKPPTDDKDIENDNYIEEKKKMEV